MNSTTIYIKSIIVDENLLEIKKNFSEDRNGNLFAIVLNPAPLTPEILSEESPHIDFARQKFSADIFLLQGRMKVNAKSVMGIIMLTARPSSELLLIVDGEDEAIVLKQFETILNTVFDEANLTSN